MALLELKKQKQLFNSLLQNVYSKTKTKRKTVLHVLYIFFTGVGHGVWLRTLLLDMQFQAQIPFQDTLANCLLLQILDQPIPCQ